MAKRFRKDQRLQVFGDRPVGVYGRPTLDPIPDGEVVTVFEDYGQAALNVMRANGQLRYVRRDTVKEV